MDIKEVNFLPILQNDNDSVLRATRRAAYMMAQAPQRGFTLIELLVVIAIIGLLASVVLVALNGARQKSRDSKRVADLSQLAKAFELYYNEHNSYPTRTTAAGGVVLSSSLTLGSPSISPNYLSQLPTAPTPADGSCTSGTANGKNDYYMYPNSTGVTQLLTSAYTITFCLGQKTGSLTPGPHTLTQAGFQ
ncbi:MAG: prepilin-type N-terminal cleavage/methylation domain-containing protein [Candidatus Doudnabacteria bacterium]|nr:prepilin-type N-terminal cleavage/methylation domain-containing protein [Candidatus Doudnabacteria bacterium]